MSVTATPPRVPSWSIAAARDAAIALPEHMTVSEWSDKNRVLSPKTSAEPGRWRTDRTPYMREIADAFSDSAVEQITLMKPTQIGGTECLFNTLGYAVDQDPGPGLFLFPKEASAKQVSRERIQPMFEASPALARHIPLAADDFSALEYRFSRMTVTLAWAGSPAQLASRPVRYFWADEVDKYPAFSGREADPIKLAKERTRTYVANRKIIIASTPTTEEGFINREYEASDQRKYCVPCPHCGAFQVFRFDNIQWPEGERDPERIFAERLAWYRCESCQGKIGDRDKADMMARGVWCPDGCTVDVDGQLQGDIPQTRHRGYWLNALYSPWLTFSEIAAEFLKSKDNPAELMNFINSWLAQVWREQADEFTLDGVKSLTTGYEQATIPAGCMVLTAGVDVQKNVFYYVIRGWGIHEESWLIDCGVVGDIDRIEEAVLLRYFDGRHFDGPDGPMQVMLCGMDARYRGDEVYALARKWPDRLYPTQGANTRAATPYERRNVVKDSRTGKALKRAHAYWRIDTQAYKDKMLRLMEPTRGLWHLYEHPDSDYLAHMVSEHRVIRRDKNGRSIATWVLKGIATPNHYFDCEVDAVAMADIKKVWALKVRTEATGGYAEARSGSGWQIGR